MTYFTILHWFSLAIVITLFILVVIISFKSKTEKSPLTTILVIGSLLVMVFSISIYGLDEYTKVARVENVSSQKILINESFSLTGQIRNIGKFKIGKCVLEVEISNDRAGELSNTSLYTPVSIFSDFFKAKTGADTTPRKQKFVIAENLERGELRNFTVLMRFPPEITKPAIRHELSCH